ncbi:GNAT family N-acetyltransferase [Echria macrotheca]|uniref:GNAT family N-acetyltransferase n=1 Tax=Echria macrotheca TaxID=438768 RepID=A0AAJ0B4Y4_9PEZI|nr:GNAT family N-acetyltransferase [Echria macrotheca]
MRLQVVSPASFLSIAASSMETTAQATIWTDRLCLVPLSDDHLEHEIQLDSDPDVVKYIGNGRPRSRSVVERLHQERMAAAKLAHGQGFWAGFLRPDSSSSAGNKNGTGEFVGWWILEPPQRQDQGPRDNRAELGYRLMKKFWRQGLAKEGAKALIRHGFEHLGLVSIYAETMAVNEASRATMRSLGMKHVRTFYLHFDEKIEGWEEGEVEYAITVEGWQALANN